MGKLTGTCEICGRGNVEIFRCNACGDAVCSRCFVSDILMCSGCVRKGLWVGSTPEA